MTFRTSLYISISAHMLAFACAIAFAYTESRFSPGQRNSIVVSLVSAGDRGGPKAGTHAPAVSKTKAAEETIAPSVEQKAPANPVPTEARRLEAKAPEPGEDSAAGGSGGNSSLGHSTEEGHRDAGGTGLITAEQWAAISSAIDRNKSYPRLARERGIEGVVHLRFRLRPGGAVESIEITKSSGSELLDRASVESVYRAAPIPYVSGWVEVPIAYILK